jgi:hypothetical protein
MKATTKWRRRILIAAPLLFLMTTVWHTIGLCGPFFASSFVMYSPVYAEPASANNLSGSVILVADEVLQLNGHLLLLPDQLVSRSSSSPELFATLHRERRWAIDETQVLHDKLVGFAARSHEKPIQVPTISEIDYNARLSDLDNRMKQNERTQADGSLPESQRVAAHLELLDITRQKARLDLRLEESHALKQAQADHDRLVNDESEAKRNYEMAEHYLFTIDDTINGLLVTTEKNNNFRLWIGGAFTALIALLISGFFIVAWNDKSIKETFLSNDRGLQFITLFSLIIAIILFGVMNILEGRELSALLGGLSGYILGRSNFGQPSDKETKAISPLNHN